MSREKLKNCPFCGGEAIISNRWRGGESNLDEYDVHCQKCYIGTITRFTRRTVIQAWNRRAS